MSYPLVSVIIPTINRPLLLDRAVKSVLKQSYPNIEILVIDVNREYSESQILTKQIIDVLSKENNIQYFSFPNLNGSQARNKGIEFCNGNLVAFLDDDDYYYIDKIQKQVTLLGKNESSNCYAVSCLTNVINGFSKKNKIIPINKDHEYFEDILLGNVHFNTSTLMFHKKILIIMKGFDEKLARYQDYDLMVRYSIKFKLLIVNEPLVILDQQDRANYSNIQSILDSKKYLESKYEDFLNNSLLGDKYLKKDKIDILKALLFNKKILNLLEVFFTKPILNFYECKNLIMELISKSFKFKFNKNK